MSVNFEWFFVLKALSLLFKNCSLFFCFLFSGRWIMGYDNYRTVWATNFSLLYLLFLSFFFWAGGFPTRIYNTVLPQIKSVFFWEHPSIFQECIKFLNTETTHTINKNCVYREHSTCIPISVLSLTPGILHSDPYFSILTNNFPFWTPLQIC